MLIVSYCTPEPDYDKIKDVTYDYNSSSDEDDSTVKTDKILTILLIVCVMIIWYTFS